MDQTQNIPTPQADHASPLPSAQPVQEAAATMTTPAPKSPRSNTWLLVVVLVILIAVAGLVGYYLFMVQGTPAPQTLNTPASATIAPTSAITPTPATESEEVDQIDTTFPTSDVSTIQNDAKSL